MSPTPSIIYTHTDEAPALATYSFLPVIRAFVADSGISVETRDISLAGRLLATMSDLLPADHRTEDALAELGELADRPDANIIKLPNISASVPQLKAAIAELQAQGIPMPDYPDEPRSEEDRACKARYDAVKGSAVNPVLRQGNSDRRAPQAVKAYARAHPHAMGDWNESRSSQVASMTEGDFRHNEQSITVPEATTARIEHLDASGTVTLLRDHIALQPGEVLDASSMSCGALISFLESSVARARTEGLLFSLHMKATMMKVSDPIIFGHAVRVFFAPLLETHGDRFEELGVDFRNGFGDLLDRLASVPEEERRIIETDIAAALEAGPDLAMVDSDRGITNLHVPSDVIIDASMPAMIRTSGQMWNARGETQDTLAVIPDSSYAGIYQAVIDDCRMHGAYDPKTMGSVPNVGLMAQKAEEYGSHDKTFEVAADGIIRIVSDTGAVLMEHEVRTGDIWRACQTKDAPIRDWVRLAVERARATGAPAVFWLDATRAHDQQLIDKVERYLKEHDTEGLEFHVLAPVEATRFSIERIRRGEDTISVTGNVLRDYLTDLFPILEVGTSAKMLSIVPLMNGGGLFETGAGGSAPKHVQQFNRENHLRWDSLGEFLALAASLDHLAHRFDHAEARVLAETLDEASTAYLMNDKSPSRRCGERDNRGTHFYVAQYWARALAGRTGTLADRFGPVADALEAAEEQILRELNAVQGEAMDIGGYYRPDPTLASRAMRPSATLNRILEELTVPA